MGRNQTKADMLLKELRVIPKLIKELERDMTSSQSVLSSPQWSDMKVQGGIKQTQTDKNINNIIKGEYYAEQIGDLDRRKGNIIQMIMQLPDITQRHVLVTTFVNCQTYDEAIDRLEMNRNTYYTIKRKAIEN
ncbi:DUF1492 domain-containing protein, partial [Parasutterella excrementihominis]